MCIPFVTEFRAMLLYICILCIIVFHNRLEVYYFKDFIDIIKRFGIVGKIVELAKEQDLLTKDKRTRERQTAKTLG